uniref:Anaphase-promoting complex subunit 11 n=1 Tax=Xenopsylla cheopis TaxID=163159 RepID=A0A6M2DRI9_XENCH
MPLPAYLLGAGLLAAVGIGVIVYVAFNPNTYKNHKQSYGHGGGGSSKRDDYDDYRPAISWNDESELRKRKQTSKRKEEDSIDKKKCFLCKKNYEKCHIIVLNECKHNFHTDCLSEFIGTKGSFCPICHNKFNVAASDIETLNQTRIEKIGDKEKEIEQTCESLLTMSISEKETKFCSICSEMDAKDFAKIKCGHEFHESCLDEFIETIGSFCLTCKKDIKADDIVRESTTKVTRSCNVKDDKKRHADNDDNANTTDDDKSKQIDLENITKNHRKYYCNTCDERIERPYVIIKTCEHLYHKDCIDASMDANVYTCRGCAEDFSVSDLIILC